MINLIIWAGSALALNKRQRFWEMLRDGLMFSMAEATTGPFENEKWTIEISGLILFRVEFTAHLIQMRRSREQLRLMLVYLLFQNYEYDLVCSCWILLA